MEAAAPAEERRADGSVTSTGVRGIAARSSITDSVRACGLVAGARIDRESLRQRITIPEYMRKAMKDAVTQKVPVATAVGTYDKSSIVEELGQAIPEAPIVVFVNSKSGGRHGKALMERLQELMGEEQVFVCLFFKSKLRS